MFYAYAGSYLTEFVIGYGQAFSHCMYAVSAGVAAATAVEDNGDDEETTWKESWVLMHKGYYVVRRNYVLMNGVVEYLIRN